MECGYCERNEGHEERKESLEDVMARCGDYIGEQFRQFEPDLPEKTMSICLVDTSPKRLKVTFTYMKKDNKSVKHGFYILGDNEAGHKSPMPDPRDDENWVRRQNRYDKNLKAQLSSEEKTKMEKSHCWIEKNDGWEHEECAWCGLDEHSMFNTPQYCDVKEL